jgi:hypothetical protein
VKLGEIGQLTFLVRNVKVGDQDIGGSTEPVLEGRQAL